ncbi:MAG: PqqD family protein [Ignavibacteria bacterium]|nr:PqqD family protein [Ignavibacteria bacterium]
MKLNRMVAISETGFVFDAETGDSYSLNPLGLNIVEMIKNRMSLEDIKERLAKEYEVTPETLDKSMDDFIWSLKGFNIIENE